MTGHSDGKIGSDASANGDAETVFRSRKGKRNEGLLCLICFLLFGIGSAYGMWIDAPLDRRIYLVVFFSLFWGCWSGLSVWLLLAYCRESLTIQNENVIQQCVISKKEMDLPSVREARWRLGNSGRITLRSLSEKLTIRLDNFERSERLWLIRYFQNGLPDSIQDGWDIFCYKIAIPLRDYDPEDTPSPSPEEVTLTRRRWDWYFIPFILLSSVFGIVACWKFQQPRMLAAPLLPVAMWLMLRFGTPKQGMVATRISAQPEHKRFLVFELWWLGVAIAGFAVFKFVKPPMPHGLIVATIACILWLGVLLWRAHLMDRARQQRDLESAKLAVQQWNEGEHSQAEM